MLVDISYLLQHYKANQIKDNNMYFLKRKDYALVKQKSLWSTNEQDPFFIILSIDFKGYCGNKCKGQCFSQEHPE